MDIAMEDGAAPWPPATSQGSPLMTLQGRAVGQLVMELAQPSTPPSSTRGIMDCGAAGQLEPRTAGLPKRPPGAPPREARRQRPRDEEEKAACTTDLAACFSSLRLLDEPPAKRACWGEEVGSAGGLFGAPRTPPRRPGSSCARRLFGERSAPGCAVPRSPFTFRWRRPSQAPLLPDAALAGGPSSSETHLAAALPPEGGLLARTCSRLLVFED